MAFVKTAWTDRQVPKLVAAQLNRIEQGVADAHPGPWHNVGPGDQPFINNWVNFDTERILRYYKAAGRVYLEGIVKSGTLGVPIFQLPVGFRPTFPGGGNLIYPVASNGAIGLAYLYNNGDVVAQPPSSNVWVDLSSISFRCE